MNVRKIIRILGVSLALAALLVFATAAVSHWHSPDSASEAQCPYCQIGHQTAVQPETAQCVAVLLLLVAFPAAAGRCRSGHGACLFANRPTRASDRVNNKTFP